MNAFMQWYAGLNKKAAVLTIATIVGFILFGLVLLCFPVLLLIFLIFLCVATIVGFAYMIISIIYETFCFFV